MKNRVKKWASEWNDFTDKWYKKKEAQGFPGTIHGEIARHDCKYGEAIDTHLHLKFYSKNTYFCFEDGFERKITVEEIKK